MSAAAGTATDAAPAKGGKKMVLIVALAVLLVGGGGAAFWVMKSRAAAAAAAAAAAEGEGEDGEATAHRAAAHNDAARTPPAFLPLETFVVNLADKDGERFAQVGVTLELDDAKAADELKGYMPAIRNGILMVLAHKTSGELATREGKERLQAEIMREAVRPLGIEMPEPGEEKAAAGKRKAKVPSGPVRRVHFSTFIMQ